MNGTATRFLRLSVSLAGLVTLGWVLTGQAARPARHGIPTDWSHHHLIFSRPGSPEQAARVSRDPRYWQQMYRRQQSLVLPAAAEADARLANDYRYPIGRPVSAVKARPKRFHRDWAEDTGPTASIGAGIYPAKYSFDIHTAFCNAATTPDYVVYGTGVAGSGAQATVVAYDNLYSGCSGTAPMVYWAYNTGTGLKVLTSPVLSRDGSQVAFVETTGGSGILVTLKWKAANGTVGAPATPTLVASMAACTTPPCMTQTTLRDGSGVAVDDETSSVYYDYTNDIAWVGGALGWLHKITGVFNGTPTEVNTGGFPVRVAVTPWISSPVYDGVSNSVFVGGANGFLYSVDATSAAVVASGQLDFGTGLVDGPVIDSSNNFVYVFASSDGGATCTAGVACAAVYQLSTTFASGTTGTKTTVGDSVLFGSLTPPNPAYIGGFDSAYYDSVSPNAATGNLYVCGNTGGDPTLYQVPIATGAMPAAGSVVAQLASTATTCSPVTDIANPNLPGGPAERVFASVQSNGAASACTGAGGCIFNFVDTPWQPFANYTVGQQVLSSKQHVETVMTAGTSAGIPPAWSAQISDTRTDGNVGTQVVWIDQGAFTSPFVTWIASHSYVTLLVKILDTNGNVQALTTTGTTSTGPTWNMTPGLTTTDGTAVWTNVGPYGSASLAAAGGTGGIIVDNTLGPFTVPGGSDVYYGTLAQGCGTLGADGCAVQATQLALQ